MVGFLSDDRANDSPIEWYIERVSSEALKAGQRGLDRAIDDEGLQYTFYLLTQLVLAARRDDWQRGLEPFGIHLSSDATIFDLTVELQSAIDNHLMSRSLSTDISEIAQQAAGESVTVLAGPRSVTLFGSGREELQTAVKELSTKRGFSNLGQQFFGRFMAHYLNFFLSRITANQVGRSQIRQIGDITRF